MSILYSSSSFLSLSFLSLLLFLYVINTFFTNTPPTITTHAGFLSPALITRAAPSQHMQHHATITTLHNIIRQRHLTQHHMFTGIVEEIGTIEDRIERPDPGYNVTLGVVKSYNWNNDLDHTHHDWSTHAGGTDLTIRSKVVLEDAYIGCSISVSGVCLTVTHLLENNTLFQATLSPETMRKSNLHTLLPGAQVNLERAAKVNARVSGHYVQGHVDCMGRIQKTWMDGESKFIQIEVKDSIDNYDRIRKDVFPYIVPKGFVSLDGTSLTICDVNAQNHTLTVMLVDHTQKHTILAQKEVDDLVNLEVDVMGKYVNSVVMGKIDRLEERVKQLESDKEEA